MSDSSTRGLWRLVAEREITTRVREKAFIISTVLVVVVVVGGIVAATFLGGRPSTTTVATVGEPAAQAVRAANDGSIAQADDLTLRTDAVADVRAAERMVRDGSVDAALVQTDDGFRLIGDESVDSTVRRAITSSVASQTLRANAESQRVDLAELQSGTSTRVSLLSPSDDASGARQVAAVIMIVVFFVTAIAFGMAIAQSVTQEKESRIVEILAAAVPVRTLLWGKIVGNTVLAFGQTLLLVVAGVATLVLTGQSDALREVGPSLALFVPFFVIGFGALATLWAVAGSLASRQQDLTSTSLPVQTLLFIPYIVAFSGSDGAKEVVSMVPVLSMILMPSRIAEGGVPVWQVGVAIVGTVIVAILLVRLGTAIYERSLLRTGKKLGYREALSLSAD